MVVILILSIGALTTAAAQQQQQLQRSMITATVSPTAQRIIDAVKAECARTIEVQESEAELGFDFESFLVNSCLFLLYESATTIVLNGDLLINQSPGVYIDNPFIWQAVDEFKVQGYAVDPVLVSGQGSQGNPHQLYVMMSR